MCNEYNLFHSEIYSWSVEKKVFLEKEASKVEFPFLQAMQLFWVADISRNWSQKQSKESLKERTDKQIIVVRSTNFLEVPLFKSSLCCFLLNKRVLVNKQMGLQKDCSVFDCSRSHVSQWADFKGKKSWKKECIYYKLNN